MDRAGALSFVHLPTPETEGLRDLLRCREDLRRARIAARNRVLKQLLRHGRVFREGKHAWTQKHREWVNRQRLDDPLSHAALEQMLIHTSTAWIANWRCSTPGLRRSPTRNAGVSRSVCWCASAESRH